MYFDCVVEFEFVDVWVVFVEYCWIEVDVDVVLVVYCWIGCELYWYDVGGCVDVGDCVGCYFVC